VARAHDDIILSCTLEGAHIVLLYTHCDDRVAGVNVGMPHTAVRLVHFSNIIWT